MFSPKDYFLVEWENVSRTLRETLRYRYSEDATSKFYKECGSRLRYVRRLINAVHDDDAPKLHQLMVHLNNLSSLITAIERSHLEEFSWPFAYALERVSRAVCSEPAVLDEEPLFFFRAEGGMSSYAVRSEYSGPSLIRQKIYSVVFPRTLKDSVLLHTIIGHEIGHAAMTAQRDALGEILRKLISGSIVAEPRKLFEWCVANVDVQHDVEDLFLAERAQSWANEFYCDLFGLIMMGPAFIPAFMTLLRATSFGGRSRYVSSHPPYAARAVALLHAARALNMLYSENEPVDELGRMALPLDAVFIESASKDVSSAFSILDQARVAEAALELADFSRQFDGLAFQRPNPDLLSQLIRSLSDDIPPSGIYPAARTVEGVQSIGQPVIIDFRDVLLAGWLRWLAIGANGEEHFRRVNELCSYAIMQLDGIDYWTRHQPGSAATTTA